MARLEYVGEIRFGPPYYQLLINGKAVPKRVFGSPMLWSADSRFLAVQEWLSTKEALGPQTALVCFDVESNRQCRVSTAENGFIEPKAFDGEKLIYTKEHTDAQGTKVNEYEIEFLPLPRWEAR